MFFVLYFYTKRKILKNANINIKSMKSAVFDFCLIFCIVEIFIITATDYL